jgi:hypothetical protein
MRFDLMNDSFDDVLEETRRHQGVANRDDTSEYARPRAPRSVGIGPAQSGGGEAGWDLAMSWTAGLDEMMAPTPSPVGEATPLGPEAAEMVAAALGIGVRASEDYLTLRWRAFVWRNHPDRQPPRARQRANALVAIANSLYQRERRKLRQTR